MSDFVVCEICKREFKSINNKHLKTHNITTKEYKEKFPDSKMVGESTSSKLRENRYSNPKAGFKPGHKVNLNKEPWCKGLTKETDQRIKSISDKSKGKKLSEKTKRILSRIAKQDFQTGKRKRLFGPDNPMFGKKLSESHKKALLNSQTGAIKTKPEKLVECMLKFRW